MLYIPLPPHPDSARARKLEQQQQEAKQKVAQETARRLSKSPGKTVAEIEAQVNDEMRLHKSNNTLRGVGMGLIIGAASAAVVGPLAPLVGIVTARLVKSIGDDWIDLKKD